MLLYMIRHGESEANAASCHAGWLQTPLSPKGKEQAVKVGEKLKDIPFTRVFSSDLIRARQTCELALPGYSYETSPLLREIGVGGLSGKSIAECKELYGDPYTEKKFRQDYTSFGGEDLPMLQRRVSEFLSMLEQSGSETTAVFAHAGTLRAAGEIILGAPRLLHRVRCPNCCLCVFEYNDGKWRLNAWNI